MGFLDDIFGSGNQNKNSGHKKSSCGSQNSYTKVSYKKDKSGTHETAWTSNKSGTRKEGWHGSNFKKNNTLIPFLS